MLPHSQASATTDAALPQMEPDYTKRAWTLIWVWGVFITLCLLVRGGRLLAPLFPLGSVGVGLFLFYRTPSLYVGYTWWFCFLASVIRRIIDQQSGFVTPGRWGITAMLVASISCITLFQNAPKIYSKGGFPFILSTIGVLYAFVIGALSKSPNLQYLVGFFEWLGPIAFGFYLFLNWHNYPTFRQVIERCFVWGVFVMGSYGIIQYCFVPAWDRFYVDFIRASSFGSPSPFAIRVFSTLGSPQAFGTVMMAGVLLLFGSQGSLRFPASGVGYLSFLLSMARSAWLGWLAGVVTFFPFLKPRLQMRFVLTILVMATLVVPIVSLEPFSEAINQRLESLSNTSEDTSLQERTEGYEILLNLAFSEVIGQGLGSGSPRQEIGRAAVATALGGSDSGILPLLFSFGWVGAIPYAGGILLILLQLFQGKDIGGDSFSSAARAIALGTFAQVGLNNIFPDAFGLVLWGFLGIGLAAQRYYAHQRSSLR
jgi:hypothetical protein